MIVSLCGHCKTAPHGEPNLFSLSFVKLLWEETFVQPAQPLGSWLFCELCAWIWVPLACLCSQLQLLWLAHPSSVSHLPNCLAGTQGIADVFLVTIDHSTWLKELQRRKDLSDARISQALVLYGREGKGEWSSSFYARQEAEKGDCGNLLALPFFPFLQTRLSQLWGLKQLTFSSGRITQSSL